MNKRICQHCGNTFKFDNGFDSDFCDRACAVAATTTKIKRTNPITVRGFATVRSADGQEKTS